MSERWTPIINVWIINMGMLSASVLKSTTQAYPKIQSKQWCWHEKCLQ